MDLVVLLLLVALYLIPEVLRRTRKPKRYEYPQFPQEEPTAPPQLEEQPFWSPAAVAVAAKPSVPAAPPLAQPQQPATRPVVLNNWQYGLVMAEILGPPSARKRGWRR
ncbi:MAG: hypothetical protein E6X17_03985 [Sporomusaceae bacterium]|nr:hypothetical protein [Sporomusaceae bacterium]